MDEVAFVRGQTKPRGLLVDHIPPEQKRRNPKEQKRDSQDATAQQHLAQRFQEIAEIVSHRAALLQRSIGSSQLTITVAGGGEREGGTEKREPRGALHPFSSFVMEPSGWLLI
jgi:hypothetical protein